MKKLKSPLRIIVIVVLGLIVGLRVYTWNAQHLTGNATPMPFGYGASVVLSGSMDPTLSVGDLLVFRQADSYAVGDVVVYQSGRTPVVHRIIEMDELTVTTQGDANNAPDAPFYTHLIRGEVIASVPMVGYLIWALKTPVGTLLTIGAAFLLMEMSYRKEREETKSEQEEIKAEIRRLMDELKEREGD